MKTFEEQEEALHEFALSLQDMSPEELREAETEFRESIQAIKHQLTQHNQRRAEAKTEGRALSANSLRWKKSAEIALSFKKRELAAIMREKEERSPGDPQLNFYKAFLQVTRTALHDLYGDEDGEKILKEWKTRANDLMMGEKG